MPELAYPVGHPAHPDYNGEPWTPQGAIHREDFPVGHLGRFGKNTSAIDSPDGFRAAHNSREQSLQELAAIGSLPPLIDPKTGYPIQIDATQLAHIYAVRVGLTPKGQKTVTEKYHLEPMAPRKQEDFKPALTAEEQALAFIQAKGYRPEAAREILARYGLQGIQTDMALDSFRK